MPRDDLLVGGDDRLAVQQRLTDPLGRRLNAADRFDDDVRVAVEDVVDEVVQTTFGVRIERAALALGAAVENLGQGRGSG